MAIERRSLRRSLLRLFFVALAVRVALACALQWLVPLLPVAQQLRAADPVLAERTAHLGIGLFWDEQANEQVAWGIAELWRSAPELIASGRIELLDPRAYMHAVGEAWGIVLRDTESILLPHVYLVAAVYALLGHQPLAARIAQSAVGALVPVLVLLLGRAWFGARVGRLAGWAAVFEPSLVVWSPWILKDEGAVLLVLVSMLSVTRVAAAGARISSLSALVLSLSLLSPVRAPVAIYLALLQPLAALAANRARINRATLALLLFLLGSSVLWLGGQGFMGARRINVDLPYQLWYARATAAEGARTAIPEARGAPEAAQPGPGQSAGPDPLQSVDAFPRVPLWATLESLERHVTYLPRALLTVIAAPAPWAVETAQDRLALGLLPTWYAAVVLGSVGLARAWPFRGRLLALPAAYLVTTLVYLALSDSAVGILLRHRLMVLPLLLPPAAYAVVRFGVWDWLARRQTLHGWRRLVPSVPTVLAALTIVAIGVRHFYNGEQRLPSLSAVVDMFELLVTLLLALVMVRSALPTGWRSWLLFVAGGALGLRLAAAVALHIYGLSVSPRAIAFDDESSFDFAARNLVETLTAGRAFASEWWHLEGHHLSLLAALYAAVGPEPLAARITGAALGASAAVLAALSAQALFGRTAGLAAGIVFGIVPGLVVWSATLLKEPLVTALVALVLWAAVRWRSAPSWQLCVLVLAALQMLASVRIYAGLGLATVVAAALAVSLLRRAGRPRQSRLARALAVVGVLGVASAISLQSETIRGVLDPVRLVYYQTVIRLVPPPFERLPSEVSQRDIVGGVVGGPIVAVDVEGEVQVPGMVIAGQGPDHVYVALSRDDIRLVDRARVRPVNQMQPQQAQRHLLDSLGAGLLRAVVAPLDSPSTSPGYLALTADALLWLALLAVAAVAALRSRHPLLLLPLAFTGLMLLVQSIIGGNAGNLVRQRAVMCLPGLILVGAPLFASALHRLSSLRAKAAPRRPLAWPTATPAPRLPME